MNESNHFTGDEHDTESNTEHTWFRQLSTTQGRWTSPDPLAGNIGNSQSLNRYAYALNDPINLTDPFGLQCVTLTNGVIGDDGTNPPCDHMTPTPPGWTADATVNGGDFPPLFNCGWDILGNPRCNNVFGNGVLAFSREQLQKLGDYYKSLHAAITTPPTDLPTPDPYKKRLFGTHWCGPGGDGPSVNALDAACQAHDQCYDAVGVDASANTGGGTLTLDQAVGLQRCNQALYDAASANSNLNGASRVMWWLKYGTNFGILAPGTASVPVHGGGK